jgi:formate-dependent phosphoribosylglycinamide formyltransferase (GAR transformylase)
MKPTVLIATTFRWFPTARLGMALAKAGCTVDAVCPWRHPIRAATAVRRTFRYNGLAPIESFAAAITASRPDLIVPCDDVAIIHLHEIYDRELRRAGAESELCAVIERSLGAPASFPVVRARTAFMNLAEEEGVRVPKTRLIANLKDLKRWATEMGFPIVLKSDGTSGGDGVRIVHTMEEAEDAFRVLRAPPLLVRALKRALVDRDVTLVVPSLLRNRFVVNAQAFVSGREATSTVACWKGTILASLHFEVLNKHDSTGPSTVLRLIDNVDMTTAAEKMVSRLGLSGVIGFDFMLEQSTGNAYLVEINPRATQVGHLTLGQGRDLPAALYAAVTGETIRESAKVTENATIALFPHEWLRNPQSPFLQSGYHDVPWEESEFIRVCVGTRRKRSALYSQRQQAQALSPVRVPRR